MSKTESKKQEIIEKLADHLLVHGMKASSLRQLAAAAGMSDRMLLHYFENKEELLTATLLRINNRLIIILENSISVQMPFHILLPHLAILINNPLIRPNLKLWLELVALASKHNDPYLPIARQISDTFFDWLKLMLYADENKREQLASLAFATIEGFVIMDTLGYNMQITDALECVAGNGILNINIE
jgi:AcrR family transcriptional regulator